MAHMHYMHRIHHIEVRASVMESVGPYRAATSACLSNARLWDKYEGL
jgi:hypothetical protein